MSIIIKSKKDNLDKYAAILIEEAVSTLLRYQSKVIFAVTGGRNVSGIFNQLKGLPVHWHKIHFFMADERMVSLNDENSNFKILNEALIEPLRKTNVLPEENVHPFILDTSKDDGGVAQYESELKPFGGKFDILLLSAGEDGHIASLFPSHASVTDDSEYFLSISDSPKPPKQRITMSRKLMLRAHSALLLFFGQEKEAAYGEFLKNGDDFMSCPARLVSKIKNSYVLTDIKVKNDKKTAVYRNRFWK